MIEPGLESRSSNLFTFVYYWWFGVFGFALFLSFFFFLIGAEFISDSKYSTGSLCNILKVKNEHKILLIYFLKCHCLSHTLTQYKLHLSQNSVSFTEV